MRTGRGAYPDWTTLCKYRSRQPTGGEENGLEPLRLLAGSGCCSGTAEAVPFHKARFKLHTEGGVGGCSPRHLDTAQRRSREPQ